MVAEVVTIAPVAALAELAAVVGAALGRDEQVVVLTAAQAKGLEFDVVLLVEPGAILTGSSRGPSDLYVAMTRSTQRLRILHQRSLPAALAGLTAPQPA